MPASANCPDRTLIKPIFTVPWAPAGALARSSATLTPNPASIRCISILPASCLNRPAKLYSPTIAASNRESTKPDGGLLTRSSEAGVAHSNARAWALAHPLPPLRGGKSLIFPPHPRCYSLRGFCVTHRLAVAAFIITLWSLCWAPPACAELAGSGAAHIKWEVKNRFRLFRSEADFERHAAAAGMGSVLAAEQRLARESDGRGWARDLVERLCVDRAGRLLEFCDRDGERESYLVPYDHRVSVVLAGNLPANEGCAWSFDDGDGPPRQVSGPCSDEIKGRLRYGRPTAVSVEIALPDGTAQRLVSEIRVRDVLIAGMGDSIAAGEGNPDRAVRLSDEGFCFKRFS